VVEVRGWAGKERSTINISCTIKSSKQKGQAKVLPLEKFFVCYPAELLLKYISITLHSLLTSLPPSRPSSPPWT